MGSAAEADSRLAVHANWLRTTTLGSDFANRTRAAATLFETFRSSPNSRTVQARTYSAGWRNICAANASSNPPQRWIAHSDSSALVSSEAAASFCLSSGTTELIPPFAEDPPGLSPIPLVRMVQKRGDVVRGQLIQTGLRLLERFAPFC